MVIFADSSIMLNRDTERTRVRRNNGLIVAMLPVTKVAMLPVTKYRNENGGARF